VVHGSGLIVRKEKLAERYLASSYSAGFAGSHDVVGRHQSRSSWRPDSRIDDEIAGG
jgi:hypothetical protein